MNIDNFINRFKGTVSDFDGYAGIQCADLARIWIEDIDGWNCQSLYFKPYISNGKYGDDGVLDGYLSFKAGFLSVINKEGNDKSGKRYKIEIIEDINQLKPGDLVFTNGVNQFGHVGIFVGRDGMVPGIFQLFDQNGSNPKSPAAWWSNYQNSTFVGALRKTEVDDKPPLTVIDPNLEKNKIEAIRQNYSGQIKLLNEGWVKARLEIDGPAAFTNLVFNDIIIGERRSIEKLSEEYSSTFPFLSKPEVKARLQIDGAFEYVKMIFKLFTSTFSSTQNELETTKQQLTQTQSELDNTKNQFTNTTTKLIETRNTVRELENKITELQKTPIYNPTKPFWQSKKWWSQTLSGLLSTCMFLFQTYNLNPNDNLELSIFKLGAAALSILGINLVVANYITAQGKIDIAKLLKDSPQILKEFENNSKK